MLESKTVVSLCLGHHSKHHAFWLHFWLQSHAQLQVNAGSNMSLADSCLQRQSALQGMCK